VQEAWTGPKVNGIHSYPGSGGSIPPIVNTHHRPLQQLAKPPALPAAVGAPRYLFLKSTTDPHRTGKNTPPPPAAGLSATCSVNLSWQRRIHCLLLAFSSAAGQCRQRESNRRHHGTSPVTQPLTQHPPHHTIRMQAQTALPKYPNCPSGLRGR
jgi:hypothetical protein